MKKFLILFSFLSLTILFIKGQNCYNKCLDRKLIDSTKVNIYKSILLSEELKKKKEFYLVNIQILDLDIDANSIFLFDSINEKTDTTSIKKINSILPYFYKIYQESNFDKYRESNKQRELLHSSFSEHFEWKISDYIYIRIFEPLDKWVNLYLYLSQMPDGAPYEIIPVLYTQIRNNKEVEKRYMFYEIIFSKEGEIESVKVIN